MNTCSIDLGEGGAAVADEGRADERAEELFGRLQSAQAGLEAGILPMFYDAESLKEYMQKRFPR